MVLIRAAARTKPLTILTTENDIGNGNHQGFFGEGRTIDLLTRVILKVLLLFVFPLLLRIRF